MSTVSCKVPQSAEPSSMLDMWMNFLYPLRLKDSEKDNFGFSEHLVNNVQEMSESQLKNDIEDTSKREAPFMEYDGKILLDIFTNHILTTEQTDKEMLQVLLKDTILQGDDNLSKAVNQAVSFWNQRAKNSQLLETCKELNDALEIGFSGTIVYDDLKEKRRYSAWMSNAMFEMSKIIDSNMVFIDYLTISENAKIPNQFGRAGKKMTNAFYKQFSRTKIASYCSKIKNFYSRFSVADDLHKTDSLDSEIVMFPIFSEGKYQGVTTRAISGFVIRGPNFPEKPTDRISLITVELLNEEPGAVRYHQFIKKAYMVRDNERRLWCIRQNSFQKNDLTVISSIIKSLSLCANMICETILVDPKSKGNRRPERYVLLYKDWIMERIVESVFKAAFSTPSEVNAFSLIRKVFMVKLAWSRGLTVYCWNQLGFAEALNEYLLDQPFTLYMAQQMRNALK